MAWNSDPTVRDLGKYADQHKYKAVIAICVMDDGRFAVNSYGKTGELCKSARKVNDQVFEAVSSGDIVIPDELL